MNNQVVVDRLMPYYKPIARAVELLIKHKYFNALYILGATSVGKSYQVDKALKLNKANYVEYSGDFSEVKFYEFLKENESGKVLLFRDMAKLLRRISLIDVIKILTESKPIRHIERRVKSNTISIDFSSKIIFEINDISKRYKEDIFALIQRGLFVEVILSNDDLKNIMDYIAKTPEDKLVTKYLISKSYLLGNNFNLRTQDKCIKLYKAAIKDKLPWKKEVDLYLRTQQPEICKDLYRFAGNKYVKREDFCRYLMSNKTGWSYSTAQRRVQDAVFLKQIYTNGLLKQSSIGLKPIKIIQIKKFKKEKAYSLNLKKRTKIPHIIQIPKIKPNIKPKEEKE